MNENVFNDQEFISDSFHRSRKRSLDSLSSSTYCKKNIKGAMERKQNVTPYDTKLLDHLVYSLLETLNPIFDQEDKDGYCSKKVSIPDLLLIDVYIYI